MKKRCISGKRGYGDNKPRKKYLINKLNNKRMKFSTHESVKKKQWNGKEN